MKKYLFIDRDGTLIREPEDEQVDCIEKIDFMPGVFESLLKLKQAGYRLVMVTNQDGLGTSSFPQADFELAQTFMLRAFSSQGIEFEDIRICPHFTGDACRCRKPEVGLVNDYIIEQRIDRQGSYVIGDRSSDGLLADNMGIKSFILDDNAITWASLTHLILNKPRTASVSRRTNETTIDILLDLDRSGVSQVSTGNRFYDHMLEQVIKHAGITANIKAVGDLDVDDHHTVEDVAIVLGEAFRDALGDKLGIGRYGFLLPMDESEVSVSLDLCGRFFCDFKCDFSREYVGSLATEMVPHFFRSFAEALRATLHIKVTGSNAHHKCEAAFKGLGRALNQAIARTGYSIASTKGVL